MEQILYLTGLGITAFVSTNIDDFFITTTFFLDERYAKGEIIIGKYLGLIFLMAISSIGYLFQLIVPIEWIGLMGIVPMSIGLRHLYTIWRAERAEGETGTFEGMEKEDFHAGEALPADVNINTEVNHAKSGIILVMLVTFANGGDNIGVYIPLFASLGPYELIFVVVIFLIMLAVLCSAAYYLTGVESISRFFRKYAEPEYIFSSNAKLTGCFRKNQDIMLS